MAIDLTREEIFIRLYSKARNQVLTLEDSSQILCTLDGDYSPLDSDKRLLKLRGEDLQALGNTPHALTWLLTDSDGLVVWDIQEDFWRTLSISTIIDITDVQKNVTSL